MTKDSLRGLMAAIVLAGAASSGRADVLFEENFDSVDLGPIVTFGDSDNGGELPSREAWSNTAPAGWSRTDQVPGDSVNEGVPEFRGWTFVDKAWWTATSGDQNRSQYTFGYGAVAVADNDEFDDFSLGVGEGIGPAYDGCKVGGGGCFDAQLTTPSISLSGVGPTDTVGVIFDSSYRPEHEQDVALEVSFDGGDFERVFTWISTDDQGVESFFTQRTDPDTGDPLFDDRAGRVGRPLVEANSLGNFVKVLDADGQQVGDIVADNAQLNQVVDVEIELPEGGASSMQVRWNMIDGGNDWWWAVDNIQVYTNEPGPRDPALRTIVDQDTGEVKILNGTSQPVDLRGYQLLSSAGNFDAAGAGFQSDVDNEWVLLSDPESAGDLSEGHIDSVTIAPGDEISLGAAWDSYFKGDGDVRFDYLVEGRADSVVGLVEFQGSTPAFLDLNFDGSVDLLDWEEFLAITDTADLTSYTVAQAYRKGDLNGDLRLSVQDYVVFQREYDRLYGAGAFSAAMASVPEPSSLLLCLLAAGLAGARWWSC